jgi:hypothetical protein
MKATNLSLQQASAKRAVAEQSATSIQQALDHKRAEQQLARMEHDLGGAEQAESKRSKALAVAEAISVDKSQIVAIERAAARVEQNRARLEAASVGIRFLPIANQSIWCQGKFVEPDTPLLISDDTEFGLEGFGRVTIRPGGGVDDLADACAESERAFRLELGKAGCQRLEEARIQLQRKIDAGAEAELSKKLVEAVAQKGLEALRQDVENQRAMVAKLAADRSPAEAFSEELRTEALEQRDAAVREEVAAKSAAEVCRSECEEAVRDAAVKEERLKAASATAHERSRELTDARTTFSDDDLRADFEVSKSNLDEVRLRERVAITNLEQADPEAISLVFSKAQNAERSIRADIETTNREIRDIEIELRTLGRDGLGEQLAEVEGQLALSQQRLGSVKLQAEGARLLFETLSEAQRESKDRWLGPVRDHVAPYLKLLQPESEIVLDDTTLEIDRLVRDGVGEPFQQLSMGAREQTAVVARLALADILGKAGQPSIVILDDALVNTDEDRLERMHLVLSKAASSLQILILTCREKDFVQLGAAIRRI